MGMGGYVLSAVPKWKSVSRLDWGRMGDGELAVVSIVASTTLLGTSECAGEQLHPEEEKVSGLFLAIGWAQCVQVD